MSKPDDIPQDVWHAAEMAVVHAPEYTARLHEDVARAIIAEREACAQVVDAMAEVIRDEMAGEGRPVHRQVSFAQCHAVLTAATAIRDRSQP